GVNTFSDLYIDSGEENEDLFKRNCPKDDQFLPLPPPPDNYEEVAPNTPTDVATVLEKLTECFSTFEEQITSLNQRVSEQVTITDFEAQRKATEEKLLYRIDRECNR
ncbi:hypothetical protein M9458_057949, partial [Cirrhinus mrigala]